MMTSLSDSINILPNIPLATVLVASSLVLVEAVYHPPPPQQCDFVQVKFANIGTQGQKLFHIVIQDGEDANENKQYPTHKVRLPYNTGGKSLHTDWGPKNVINLDPGKEAILKLKPCNNHRIEYIHQGVKLHDPTDADHQTKHVTIDKAGTVDCSPSTLKCEYKAEAAMSGSTPEKHNSG